MKELYHQRARARSASNMNQFDSLSRAHFNFSSKVVSRLTRYCFFFGVLNQFSSDSRARLLLLYLLYNIFFPLFLHSNIMYGRPNVRARPRWGEKELKKNSMLQQQWELVCDVMWRLTHPALAIIAPSSAVSDLWLKSDRRNHQNLCCVLFFRVLSVLHFSLITSSSLCWWVWLWGGLIDWKVDRAALEISRTAREAKQWCKVMRKITFTNLSINVL